MSSGATLFGPAPAIARCEQHHDARPASPICCIDSDNGGALTDSSPKTSHVRHAVHPHQRPKLERRYGDTLFCVLRPARYVDETETVEFSEVHVFAGPHFVVTVRHGEAPGDLDALVVYALEAGSDVEAAGLLLKRKVDGLDLRYVPGDVGPALLIRMSCFFHTLYQSRDRHGDQASFLITMEM